MIQYANRGFRAYVALLICMKGSVVPSALPPAIMSTGISIAVALTHREGDEVVPDLSWANQAFAIQIYAIILGFLIVTRTNMALARYTNALEGLQVMISKWLDAYMQVCSFVNAHLEADDKSSATTHLLAWREQMAHWFSLMATFAVASLRGDGGEGDAHFVGDEDAEDDGPDVVRLMTRSSGLHLRDVNLPRVSTATEQSAESQGRQPETRRPEPRASMGAQGSSSSLKSTKSAQGRASRKSMREEPRSVPIRQHVTLATLAVHAPARMQDLFTAVSAMGRSDTARWPRDVGSEGDSGHLEYLGSCSDGERTVLSQVHDKVLVVSGWICESITRTLLRNRPNAPEGPVLKVPPPVVSRVYQELSNGMQAYHKAMMVVIVPFPFPFAQMLFYLLGGFTLLAPFMVLQFTRSVIFSPILTFVAVFGYNGTDYIAKEIENPFGEDRNDLPLLGMHRDYNNSIRELLLPHPHLGSMGQQLREFI